MARSEMMGKPVLGSWQALLDYLAIDMAHLTVERVRILYLDTRNRLMDDHHLGDGSVDEAAIHPREVIRRVDCRSEEHTSKLQSLMRTSYAVFCLKQKPQQYIQTYN